MMLDNLPPMMFVLLPVFAFLLKLTYISTGRYYTEHLVLAVHNHCFIYLAALLIELFGLISTPGWLLWLSEWLIIIIASWIPLYLWLSLKVFYRQSVAKTLIKSMFISLSYIMLLSFTLTMAALWGLFTL